MSSDGEISVSVNAEGTEDAVGEMGGDAGGGVPGGGGGGDGGDGGGRGGGKFGKLLTRIAGLLALLGPILSVLGVVSGVLEAFVAPLAVVLLRLLQPVLATLIQVLPVWFDIVEFIGDVADKVGPLAGILGLVGLLLSVFMNADGKLGQIRDRIVGELKDAITSLPGQIWNEVKQLDTMIGEAVINALPSSVIPDGPGDVTDEQRDIIDRAETASDVARASGIAPPVSIALEGGLDALVNRIERDPNKDV